MFDFKFQPETYFSEETTSVLLIRISFPESTWGEQISIYAHQGQGKITYEAVDFYGSEYLLIPSSSFEPLTFDDAVYLVEGMQLHPEQEESGMQLVLDGIPEAESIFYPEMKRYFAEKRKNFGLD
ncbi:hypothetical protein Aoki45_22930 [Algoriphagus sp. oki45]|uniref:UDP-glucuronosyltransferase n=1 Tax=Algoriphagus sp. oki45 TaxID=3067294 RepID=UPI0027F800FB|nr:hypothetical protein Aoki45_22930 [Algoriphagus sp. oki45]